MAPVIKCKKMRCNKQNSEDCEKNSKKKEIDLLIKILPKAFQTPNKSSLHLDPTQLCYLVELEPQENLENLLPIYLFKKKKAN